MNQRKHSTLAQAFVRNIPSIETAQEKKPSMFGFILFFLSAAVVCMCASIALFIGGFRTAGSVMLVSSSILNVIGSAINVKAAYTKPPSKHGGSK